MAIDRFGIVITWGIFLIFCWVFTKPAMPFIITILGSVLAMGAIIQAVNSGNTPRNP
jgi:hypothetical protein